MASIATACFPSAAEGADLRLERAAHLHEHERRQVVEVGGAEVEVAIRQLIAVDRDIAVKPRRSEAERQIVGAPTSVGRLGDMGGTLQLVAIDVARGQGRRLDLPGDGGGALASTERPEVLRSSRWPSPRPCLQRGVEVFEPFPSAPQRSRPCQRPGDRGACLRHVHARLEAHLLAAEFAIELRGAMRPARGEIAETEPPPVVERAAPVR